MRPFSFAFSFPAAFLSYAHPRASRSSSRLPSRRASRLMRSVAVVRRVVRRAVSSARLVSLVVSYGRRFALLFARSRLVCWSVIALRSRAASFLIASRLSLVSSAVSSAHLVRRFVRFHPWVSRIRSRAWFSCSRRSVLLFARSCSSCSASVHVLGRGAWLCVMVMGRQGLALLISSVPSWLPACGGSLVA